MPARRSRTTILALFGGALVGSVALALILTLLASPPEEVAETCVYPDPCGPPRGTAELVSLTAWDSPLGYSFRYNADLWTLAEQDDAGVTLRLLGREDATLRIVGETGTTPEAALASYVDGIRGRVPDLTEDRRPFRLVLGPAVGFRDGAGASYAGHVGSAQGPGPVVTMSAMAAEVGGLTVLVSMEMTGEEWIRIQNGSWRGEHAFQEADSIINTVRWTSEEDG